jgi:hypothetical protein
MKRSFRTLGVLALASGLALTGCKKDIETSDFTLDQTKQGTVKAYVYAEFNKQTNGKEYAPDGTMVILSIDASQLNGNIAAGKAKWTDTVTVKNGMIEKKVPTTNKGVTVTLIANEITGDQTQEYATVPTTIKKYYSVAVNPTVTVYPNQTASTKIDYNQESSISLKDMAMVTCNLKITAETMASNAGLESVLNRPIEIYTEDWYITANTDADGKILNISLPAGTKDVSIRFTASKTWTELGATSPTTKVYRYETTFDTPTENWVPLIEIGCGDGTPWYL